jgi:mycofactocin precursor
VPLASRYRNPRHRDRPVDRIAAAVEEVRMSPLHSLPPQAAPVPDAESGAGDVLAPESLIEEDDLIEEVSIDGMCGVY